MQDDANKSTNFIGFDWENVWEFGSGGYPYPQLIDNSHKN
jgi:hypothetical protein